MKTILLAMFILIIPHICIASRETKCLSYLDSMLTNAKKYSITSTLLAEELGWNDNYYSLYLGYCIELDNLGRSIRTDIAKYDLICDMERSEQLIEVMTNMKDVTIPNVSKNCATLKRKGLEQ